MGLRKSPELSASKITLPAVALAAVTLLASCTSDDVDSTISSENQLPTTEGAIDLMDSTSAEVLVKFDDPDGEVVSASYFINRPLPFGKVLGDTPLDSAKLAQGNDGGFVLKLDGLEPDTDYELVVEAIYDNDGGKGKDLIFKFRTNPGPGEVANKKPTIAFTDVLTSFAENTPINTPVATIVDADEDGSIVGKEMGEGVGDFKILGNQVVTAREFNFEDADANNSHKFSVKVVDNDGAETTSDTKTVLETNVLEPQMVPVFNDGLLANGENFVQVADEGIDVNDANNWKIYKHNQPRITKAQALSEIDALNGMAGAQDLIDGLNFDGTMPTHANGVSLVQYNNDTASVNYQKMEWFDADSNIIATMPRNDYARGLTLIYYGVGSGNGDDFNFIGTNAYNVHKKAMENVIGNATEPKLAFYEAVQDYLTE